MLHKNGRRFESDPSHAIVAVLTPPGASREITLVTVVDHDVDQCDPEAVEWAQNARQLGDMLTAKAGIEATIPLAIPELIETYRRALIPETA